jgi:hypothetical protein
MAKPNPMPSQAAIQEILHYDPTTGFFRWKIFSGPARPGDIAGGKTWDGYLNISLQKKSYKAHRLAWVVMTGHEPVGVVDHIDGNPSNNAWSNLRLATIKQNCENRRIYSNNTSGFRGVSFSKELKKWSAQVTHFCKSIHLGYFDTAEQAAEIAAKKRAELFTHETQRN